MIIKVGKNDALTISDDVVKKVLNIYPEENLQERSSFAVAFQSGYIDYKVLIKESESLYIPWQMFFLTPDNLKRAIKHIEDQRVDKFSPKFFTKRTGQGEVTSKRIVDRLVRLQNYIVSNSNLPINQFCGALKGKKIDYCIQFISNYFEINEIFFSKTKDDALNYLIENVESKSINVSTNALKAGVLPEVKGVNEIYKSTSGFVIKDDRIPFIFLPNENNLDEIVARHIYTILYLLTCIALDDYDFYIKQNFVASAVQSRGPEAKKHEIVTGILLPREITNSLYGGSIDKELIDSLVSIRKMTPTAILVTLKKRGIITQDECDALMPKPYKPNNKRGGRRAKITNSVKKFCGKTALGFIENAIRNGSIKSIQAQYLIFGRVRKKDYKTYCQQIWI